MENFNGPASMLNTQDILRYGDLIIEAEAAAVVIRRALEYNLKQKNPESALRYTEKGLDTLIERLKGLRAGYHKNFCYPIINAAIKEEAEAIKAEEGRK